MVGMVIDVCEVWSNHVLDVDPDISESDCDDVDDDESDDDERGVG